VKRRVGDRKDKGVDFLRDFLALIRE